MSSDCVMMDMLMNIIVHVLWCAVVVCCGLRLHA